MAWLAWIDIQLIGDEVRGSCWVIVKRRLATTDDFSSAASGIDGNDYELHMMTSATLIEALYSCVADWLHEKGKASLSELDEKEQLLVCLIRKLLN